VVHDILSFASLYLTVGIGVALVLVHVVGRIDPAARGAYGFRLLLLPGAVLLWPLVIALTLRAFMRLPRRAS
jgi:hypothetical protein